MADCRSRRLRLVHRLDAIESLAQLALRNLDIGVILQIEPQLRRCAERLAEPKGRIGRNSGLLAGDPLDSRARQAASLGQGARREFERNKELLRRTSPGRMGLSFLAII